MSYLAAGEQKKKIYPTNFTRVLEDVAASNDEELNTQSTYQVVVEDEDALTAEVVEMLAQSGDDDALMVQQFERDFEDMMQDIPDLLAVSLGFLSGSQSSHQRSQKVKRILATKGPNQGSWKRSPWRFPRRSKRRSKGWKGGVALQD